MNTKNKKSETQNGVANCIKENPRLQVSTKRFLYPGNALGKKKLDRTDNNNIIEI